MLIDCDTCTVRGQGCDDCVVTVLLGAPPGWGTSDPTVVPLTRRNGPDAGAGPRRAAAGLRAARAGEGTSAGRATDERIAAASDPWVEGGDALRPAGDAPEGAAAGRDVRRIDTADESARPVVELDDVERRAVRALAEFGLVPPLRHQDASTPGDRHVS